MNKQEAMDYALITESFVTRLTASQRVAAVGNLTLELDGIHQPELPFENHSEEEN